MAEILVVEDDANIREGIAETLLSECYEVVLAANGLEALEKYRKARPDLILLDVMMPGKSGYDVCREIRAVDSTTPIIMLTAKGEEFDKVLGLSLGADDYVVKPFGIRELLARVAAVLRRCTPGTAAVEGTNAGEPFKFGGCKVDPRRYCLVCGKKEYPLSDREMRLIVYFSRHEGEVLSRDALLNNVWGMEYYGNTRTLDQHISQLRKKFGNSSPIETVHGIGYRYVADR